MEKIMIHREDQDYGPYSLEQARELTSQGILTSEDLAWMEGAATWVPLSALFTEVVPATPAVTAEASAFLVPTEKVMAESPKSTAKMAHMVLFSVVSLFLVLGGAAVYDMKTILAPVVTMASLAPSPGASTKAAAPSNRLFAATTSIQGDTITATIVTDDAHRTALCDEVMGEIYTLANQNASANTITVIVHVDDGKSAKFDIDDLVEVRVFSNMTDYVKSEHRDFIGSLLLSAGVIDEIPPAR